MANGFAPPRQPPRTIRVWFSNYAEGEEDEPLAVTQERLPAVPGQDIARLAVLHGRRLLQDPAVFEVIAHRGPHPEPQRGDDVIARVCREPFRGSSQL